MTTYDYLADCAHVMKDPTMGTCEPGLCGVLARCVPEPGWKFRCQCRDPLVKEPKLGGCIDPCLPYIPNHCKPGWLCFPVYKPDLEAAKKNPDVTIFGGCQWPYDGQTFPTRPSIYNDTHPAGNGVIMYE